MCESNNKQWRSGHPGGPGIWIARLGLFFLIGSLVAGYMLPGALGTQAASVQQQSNKVHVHQVVTRSVVTRAVAKNAPNWIWFVQHSPERTFQGTVVQVKPGQRLVVFLALSGQLYAVQLPNSAALANVRVGSHVSVRARIWHNIGFASSLRLLSVSTVPTNAFPPVGQGTVSVVGVVISIGSSGVMSLSPGPATVQVTPQTRFLTTVVPGSTVHVIAIWVNGVLVAKIIQASPPIAPASVPVPVAPSAVSIPLVAGPGPAAPLPGATYGGRAFGASLAGTMIADTGVLPGNGGAINGFAGLLNLQTSAFQLVAPTVPGAAAIARVSAGGTNVTSVGTLLNFRLTLGSVVISADTVQAEAFAQCTAAPSGQTLVTDLRITGVTPALSFNGSANQTFTLPNNLGTLIANEQTVNGSSITVNALHIHTTSGQDFILGSAQASLSGCSLPVATTVPATATPTPVTGSSAAGANVAGTSIASITSCNTSGFAGAINQQGTGFSLVAPTVPGAAALSQIICAGQTVTSTGVALNSVFIVNGVSVQVDTAQAEAIAQCGVAPRGSVTITGLRINGAAVAMTGLPNQTVALPNNQGTLTIDEQIVNGSSLTVNAVDLRMANGQSIILGTATAMPLGCAAAVQPAAVATPQPVSTSTSTGVAAGSFPVTIVGFVMAHTHQTIIVAWGAERFTFTLGFGASNLVGLPVGSLVAIQGTWNGSALTALSGAILTASGLNGHAFTVVGHVVMTSAQKVVVALAGQNVTIEVTVTTPGLSSATIGRMVSIQGTVSGAMYLASQITTL